MLTCMSEPSHMDFLRHRLTSGVVTPVDRKPSISHCCFLRPGRGAVLCNRLTGALSLA